MTREYTEIVPGKRYSWILEGKTSLGETVYVEFINCETMDLWRKHGYTNTKTFWYIEVYAFDGKRSVFKYNPTVKPGGHDKVMDFDWVLEATEDNREKIADEIERLAFGEVCKRSRTKLTYTQNLSGTT